ncbi:asparagine synthase (glutamine-hydrolyzing) [Candidatus Protofrankia californiensis]|uniref:asparagine synthase (glutamine-hydrolyzing) n=1 Tax=Candidatus Protofrankia californiensis TaxID=1839754 RepID=A0A1C3NY65_9ACTN|nr:asparagine synthase (glutamine-hydrolyzing) [Candidatus Protofrankia californiensis]
MTFCGVFRLDGQPAAPKVADAMLAASVVPVDQASVRRYADGPLALVAAPEPALGPGPTLATSTVGPLAVIDGWIPQRGMAGADRGRDSAAARIAAAFAARGTACLDDLLGDWVALLWDPRGARLVLARAVLSWRRVAVYCDGARLLFGTELAQLRAAGIPLRVDEAAVGEALTLTQTTMYQTLIHGVERIPDGSLLDIQVGRAPARRAFTSLTSIVPPMRRTSVETSARVLRAALDAAVDTAVPDSGAAVQLSGGVDSSMVTGLAHQLVVRRRTGRLLPVSMVFPDQPYDESSWIDAVQAHLGITALRVTPGPYDWDRWRAWTATTGEVPPRPNAALLSHVLDAVRAEGLTVALTGEGGDDWYAGWRRHWPDLLRAGHLAPLWRESGSGHHPRALARRLCLIRRSAWGPLRAPPTRPVIPCWIRPQRLRGLDLDGRQTRTRAADTAGFASHDHRARWAPAARRMGASLLDSVRLAATVAGVDWRHPLHDPRAVRCALSTGGGTLYSPGLTKQVLRAAAGDALPPAIHARRDKARFDLEIVHAVETAGGLRTLATGPLVTGGWIDLAAAENAWASAAALARRGRTPTAPQHSLPYLWQLLELDTWLTHAGVQE